MDADYYCFCFYFRDYGVMTQLDEFPAVIDENHPFYKAVEVYNDEGEIFRAPELIEYDRTPGVPNVTYKIRDSRQGAQGRKAGAWRLRWREDVIIDIKDVPKVTSTLTNEDDTTGYIFHQDANMPGGDPYPPCRHPNFQQQPFRKDFGWIPYLSPGKCSKANGEMRLVKGKGRTRKDIEKDLEDLLKKQEETHKKATPGLDALKAVVTDEIVKEAKPLEPSEQFLIGESQSQTQTQSLSELFMKGEMELPSEYDIIVNNVEVQQHGNDLRGRITILTHNTRIIRGFQQSFKNFGKISPSDFLAYLFNIPKRRIERIISRLWRIS